MQTARIVRHARASQEQPEEESAAAGAGSEAVGKRAAYHARAAGIAEVSHAQGLSQGSLQQRYAEHAEAALPHVS